MLIGNETVTILLSEYERLKQVEALHTDNTKDNVLLKIDGCDFKVLNHSQAVMFLFDKYKNAYDNCNTWMTRARKAGWSAEKHGISPF